MLFKIKYFQSAVARNLLRNQKSFTDDETGFNFQNHIFFVKNLNKQYFFENKKEVLSQPIRFNKHAINMLKFTT